MPSVQPSYLNENFVTTSKNLLKNMKTRVCPKYFVSDCDCLLKKIFSSNLPQTPLNLICKAFDTVLIKN